MTMQERLHTKITGIQVEDTSKTLLLQSMHHKEEVGRTKPLPGDSNEPSVHDKSADELHSDEDGEPRLNIDLAALIENNRDNEFLARLLQGDSPGADPRKIARDRSGAKPPITSEATLVTPSPGDASQQDVTTGITQESRTAIGLRGQTPDLPMRPVISGPSVQARRPPNTTPFQGFVPMSAHTAGKGRGTTNISVGGQRQSSPARARVEDLRLADLASIGSNQPQNCERQLIELALRKMFSKLETVAIDHVVDAFREWRLPPNVAIVQQGAPITTGPGLCILKDGVIDVLHCPTGKGAPARSAELERVCTYDRNGQCFGELELIYNGPRPNGAPRKTHWATIATRTQATVWTITRDALQQEVLRSSYLGAEATAWAPVTGIGNVLTMV